MWWCPSAGQRAGWSSASWRLGVWPPARMPSASGRAAGRHQIYCIGAPGRPSPRFGRREAPPAPLAWRGAKVQNCETLRDHGAGLEPLQPFGIRAAGNSILLALPQAGGGQQETGARRRPPPTPTTIWLASRLMVSRRAGPRRVIIIGRRLGRLTVRPGHAPARPPGIRFRPGSAGPAGSRAAASLGVWRAWPRVGARQTGGAEQVGRAATARHTQV